MPKVVPVEEKRVPLNCLISPQTREIVTSMGCSQGEAVDRCAAVWLERAQSKLDAVFTPAVEKRIKANVMPRPFKGTLLRPKERK
jgi:hypothetical protein